MKKLSLVVLALYCMFGTAQTSSQLIAIHQFANLAAINAISNPVRGNLTFNQNDSLLYYFDGLNWIQCPSNSVSASASSWELAGNIITSSDFIGTTNNADLRFRVNNVERWRMNSRGTLIPVNTGDNVYIGQSAGNSQALNATSYNVGLGFESLKDNTSGDRNTSVGGYTLNRNTTGSQNVALGNSSRWRNTTGSRNVAAGTTSLVRLNSGTERNVAIGRQAYAIDPSGAGFSNSCAIGVDIAMPANNTFIIGNSNVSSIGGLVAWSTPSDQRFKENIVEDIEGLDFILNLRPVSYNFNYRKKDIHQGFPDSLLNEKDYQKTYQIVHNGFLAQEVKALADSLNFNFHALYEPKNSKDTYALRYAEFVAPIVKAIQEQQGIIEQQNKQIHLLKKEVDLLKKESKQAQK